MNHILLRLNEEYLYTNTFDLLDMAMASWDGVGLPDKAWMEAHFTGEALNGTLSYEPDTEGGFVFKHNVPGAEAFYVSLEEMEENEVDAYLPYVLSALLEAGFINDAEYQSLRLRYGLPEVKMHIDIHDGIVHGIWFTELEDVDMGAFVAVAEALDMYLREAV